MTAYTDQANTLGATQVYGVDFADVEWKDESGNALHLTRVGATTEAGPGDGLDTALSCDGVDDYAFRADEAALEIGATHTVCYWVKRNGVIASFAHEVGKANDSWHTRDRADGHEWNINGGNSIIQEDVGDTSWHFVVIRQDDGANTRVLRSYGTDGVQLAAEETGVSVGTPNTVQWDFSVGAQDHDGYRRFYNGAFAGLAIFDGIALTDAEIDDLLDSTFDAGAGGQTVAIGTLAQTDSPVGVGVDQPVVAAVGTLAQTDTPVGVAAEQPIDQAVGTLAQSEAQVGIAQSKLVPVGALAQTDSLVSVSGLKTASVGVLAESDSLVTVPPLKAIEQAVGILAETDSLQAISGRKTADIGVLAELEALIGVSGRKLAAIGTLAESDALVAVQAQLGGDVSVPVGILAETDSLIVVSGLKTADIGTLAELESLVSVGPGRRFAVATLAELEALIAVGGLKAVQVGTLAESNILVAVTPLGGFVVVHTRGRTAIDFDRSDTAIVFDDGMTELSFDSTRTFLDFDDPRRSA